MMSGEAPAIGPVTLRDKIGTEYVVRVMEPSDREALLRFYEQFEPKRRAQGLPPSGIDRITSWLDSILTAGFHLLAFRDDELVGHALVMPTGREGVGEYAIFLREDIRGQGFGTELNRHVVDASRAAGLRGLWLTVEPRNRPAIRSYEKVGFRFIPETVFSIEAEMEMPL